MPPTRRVLLRSSWLAALALALTPLAGGAAADQGIAIVVAPGHPLVGLDRRRLAAIFKRKQRVSADGAALVPVNLPATAPLRIAFSRAVFAQDPAGLDHYWNERYFHGIPPPHVVDSVEAMLRFVVATPGAIGYVPACRADARVRVLLILPVPVEGCPAAH
jgi:hypothetical protein